jgi:hypothetical protein
MADARKQRHYNSKEVGDLIFVSTRFTLLLQQH